MVDRPRSVHFVGVGGSGMSAIAEVLLHSGARVSGSDLAASTVTERLARLGLEFYPGHAAAHVGAVDVVVISSAVRPTNPEVVEAGRRGIRVIRRGDMLAELMGSRYGIAIAGAHGKTTTTSMIALVLERAGLDPTAVIGGRLAAFGSNARIGASEYLVAEADESDRSFLTLMPTVAVITNIDREHLESYAGFDDLVGAFVSFANRVPAHGAAVVCADDPHLRAARHAIAVPMVTYGLESPDADLTVTSTLVDGATSRVTVARRTGGRIAALGTLTLHVPGRHNVLNALAAIATAQHLGLTFDRIAPGLEAFRGADRRFEIKGEARGVTVVDDYGHHPTEIAAVLQAARASHPGRVLVAFQPHRYSRTAQLMRDFGPALAGADEIVLTDIYPAGEAPIPGATLDALAASIESAAPGRVHVVPILHDVPAAVTRLVRPGDLVITLGAGSIGTAGPRILEEVARCR
jgi:UDP-N-acetylmuramate--alanine ligase